MKRTNVLTLFPFIALTLTSCVNGISKDEYEAKLSEVEANYANITDVHINNRNNTTKYDYKEGEFYGYYNFALIIFVPITQGTYTWKDGDKYYHTEVHADSSKTKKSEISKEQFDTYMTAHKAKILSLMSEVTLKIHDFMQENPTTVSKAENEYKYDSFNKEYHFYSKVVETYQDSEGNPEKTDYFVSFKDQKLKEYHAKTGTSDSYRYFSYGDAKFNEPTMPDNNSSNNQ